MRFFRENGLVLIAGLLVLLLISDNIDINPKEIWDNLSLSNFSDLGWIWVPIVLVAVILIGRFARKTVDRLMTIAVGFVVAGVIIWAFADLMGWDDKILGLDKSYPSATCRRVEDLNAHNRILDNACLRVIAGKHHTFTLVVRNRNNVYKIDFAPSTIAERPDLFGGKYHVGYFIQQVPHNPARHGAVRWEYKINNEDMIAMGINYIDFIVTQVPWDKQ